MTTIINEQLFEKVTRWAQNSPRLRMNYNFHQSLDELCHRMLNALEAGTEVPIHRHPTKDETFILMRGVVRVLTYNDDGTVIDDILLSQESSNHGVNIPKNVWHTIQSIEPAVLFECKEGPFVPHEEEGILVVKSEK